MSQANARNRPDKGPEFRRTHEPDRQVMLAALRVVLGLPRIPSKLGQDDLLSDAS